MVLPLFALTNAYYDQQHSYYIFIIPRFVRLYVDADIVVTNTFITVSSTGRPASIKLA